MIVVITGIVVDVIAESKSWYRVTNALSKTPVAIKVTLPST